MFAFLLFAFSYFIRSFNHASPNLCYQPDLDEISNCLRSGLPTSFLQPLGPTPLHQIGYSGLAPVLFRAWAGQPQPNLLISVRVEWPGWKSTDFHVDPDLS